MLKLVNTRSTMLTLRRDKTEFQGFVQVHVLYKRCRDVQGGLWAPTDKLL